MADRRVVVVGGANSAGQAAVYLARHAEQVTVLLRGASLAERMSAYLVQELERAANVIVRPPSGVGATLRMSPVRVPARGSACADGARVRSFLDRLRR